MVEINRSGIVVTCIKEALKTLSEGGEQKNCSRFASIPVCIQAKQYKLRLNGIAAERRVKKPGQICIHPGLYSSKAV